MSNYRIVSSDNHILEPPDLWTTRLEPKFRDRAPRVERTKDRGDWWFCNGNKGVAVGVAAQAGRRFTEPEKLTFVDYQENVLPGAYIPEEHVKDMDIDGVDVSLIYPTVGLLLYTVDDADLLNALFKTYNDWVAEFCRANPKRLKAVAMLNIDDVPLAIKEMERASQMGLVGAMISCYPPENKAYDSKEYDPLWAAAQDMDFPLSLHIGTVRPFPGSQFVDVDNMSPAFFVNVDHWVRMSVAHLILSGVFERFPKLRVGVIEHELLWALHFLDRLDYTYTQRPPGDLYGWHRFKNDMLPSDYFRQNIFLSFQEDGLGVKFRNVLGVQNLMFSSDYPHYEGTFPRSRQIVEEICSGCTEEETANIAGENCGRMYHI